MAAAPILGQLLLAAVLIYALIGPMQVLLPRLAGIGWRWPGWSAGCFSAPLRWG